MNRRRPRTPGVFRIGDRARPDVQEDRTRLTLYVTHRHLDLAEKLAASDGFPTIQKYCEHLLENALDGERARHKLDDAEAKHGVLQGFREIEEDVEYLAEWNASIASAIAKEAPSSSEIVVDVVPQSNAPRDDSEVILSLDSPSVHAILAHAGLVRHAGDSFLAHLRRGSNPPSSVVADLVESLAALAQDLGSTRAIDRRLAYALHRLAFESQVLATDAFPGAFDADTIHTLHALQEAVDRILSGEDIRYVES